MSTLPTVLNIQPGWSRATQLPFGTENYITHDVAEQPFGQVGQSLHGDTKTNRNLCKARLWVYVSVYNMVPHYCNRYITCYRQTSCHELSQGEWAKGKRRDPCPVVNTAEELCSVLRALSDACPTQAPALQQVSPALCKTSLTHKM